MSDQPIVPYVVNDMVIREDNCNLTCEYCLTGQSLFKEDHSLQKIFDPPRPDSCEPGSELRYRLQKVLDAVATQDVPVVKISGGEVTLIRGIMGFIEELSERYETVVILTNGLLITEKKLERLRALGNIVLQISLDATRYQANSYRVPSAKVHVALMERIHTILCSGLPVEIYTVLNDRSMDGLEDTLDDMLPYINSDVCLFPFPVRGPTREKFLPRPDQYPLLRRVIDQADRYGGLLPGPLYLERLWQFFMAGGRKIRCHLPRVAFTAFDDGMMTSCPNIWFNHPGNFLHESAEKVFRAAAEAPFRRLLLADQPRIDACKACYTPWDPVSLYFEDKITLEELTRVPIYRGARTQKRLAEIRAAYFAEKEQSAFAQNSLLNEDLYLTVLN